MPSSIAIDVKGREPLEVDLGFKRFLAAAGMASAVGACGCVEKMALGSSGEKEIAQLKGSAPELQTQKVSEPQLQQDWQRDFLTVFHKQGQDWQFAYALFTSGGWSNDGQILIFGAPGKGGKIMYGAPNSKAIDSELTIPAGDFDGLAAKLKDFSSLSDLETGVMDGIQYEYVSAERNKSGEIKIIKRVYMNNPGIGKPAPEHSQLVDLFKPFKIKAAAAVKPAAKQSSPGN
jgi:hypothetical protein